MGIGGDIQPAAGVAGGYDPYGDGLGGGVGGTIGGGRDGGDVYDF